MKYISLFYIAFFLTFIFSATTFKKDKVLQGSSKTVHTALNAVASVAVTCFGDASNLIAGSVDIDAEINKIRAAYALIEKEKNQFHKFFNLPGQPEIMVHESIDSNLMLYGDVNVLKDKWDWVEDRIYRHYGNYKATYYLDDDLDIRCIEIREFDNYDGFWSNTFYFYYIKGARHPFFHFAKGYSENHEEEERIIEYYQERIYYKIDTTIDADCPEIIRALSKKITNPKNENEINNVPNQSFSSAELQNLAKQVYSSASNRQDKTNYIFKPYY